MSTTEQFNGSEMSNAELCQALEHITGLPCPPRGAPNEMDLWAEWEVASNFLMALRKNENPEEARKLAAEYTLRNHALPIEQLVPHIETAIGRRLTGAELQSGILA